MTDKFSTYASLVLIRKNTHDITIQSAPFNSAPKNTWNFYDEFGGMTKSTFNIGCQWEVCMG